MLGIKKALESLITKTAIYCFLSAVFVTFLTSYFGEWSFKELGLTWVPFDTLDTSFVLVFWFIFSLLSLKFYLFLRRKLGFAIHAQPPAKERETNDHGI